MAFATEQELEDYTGRSIATARATIVLDTATAVCQAEARQKIERVADDQVVLRGAWGRELWLPQRPVEAIGALAIDGLQIAENTGYEWEASGRLTRVHGTEGPGHWGGPLTEIAATYTHGYAQIPQDIRGVCLALAARLLTNPGGDVQAERIASYSVTRAREAAGLLNDDERGILHRYRRRTTGVAV